MGMMSEFKEFAMRGNVIDLAVGVVIGAAFGKIVTALVDKIIMPPIGLLIGGVDFSKWVITLKAATMDAAGKEVPAVVHRHRRIPQHPDPVHDHRVRDLHGGQGDQPDEQAQGRKRRPQRRKTCCCCARSATR